MTWTYPLYIILHFMLHTYSVVLKECILQLNMCFSLGQASSFQTSYLIMTISQEIQEHEESLLSSAGNKPLSLFSVGIGIWPKNNKQFVCLVVAACQTVPILPGTSTSTWSPRKQVLKASSPDRSCALWPWFVGTWWWPRRPGVTQRYWKWWFIIDLPWFTYDKFWFSTTFHSFAGLPEGQFMLSPSISTVSRVPRVGEPCLGVAPRGDGRSTWCDQTRYARESLHAGCERVGIWMAMLWLRVWLNDGHPKKHQDWWLQYCTVKAFEVR